MKVKISSNQITGFITAPASKSVMQRAIALSLLSYKEIYIHNYGKSNDDKAALSIIEELGATVTYLDDENIKIKSNFLHLVTQKLENTIDINCGESGLSSRMFTPIASLLHNPVNIDGKGSLRSRPMNFFEEIFPQISVDIKATNGCLPLRIKGPLEAQNITIDGSLSSQFLTGLLLAYSISNKNATINVIDLKSKPYIDITLKMMEEFGLNVPINDNYTSFIFKNNTIQKEDRLALHYTVEGDWSSASFLLVAAAINGNIILKGLNTESPQADKMILEALQLANAPLNVSDKDQIQIKTSDLKSFIFDANNCPDLFPPLVALAANCAGKSLIKGINRLVHKESNRAITLQSEFNKMGISIELIDDDMIVYGGQINSATVNSQNDHRIAMACAIAGLKSGAEITIENAEAIDKSYPEFYNDLQKLNISVKYQ